jgi:hypothetical protein
MDSDQRLPKMATEPCQSDSAQRAVLDYLAEWFEIAEQAHSFVSALVKSSGELVFDQTTNTVRITVGADEWDSAQALAKRPLPKPSL